MMNKIIFGVFAHPDDEAFGPSGALLLETRSGTQLHLITLTTGQAGVNPDSHNNLGEIRHQEWLTAGDLLGASSMHSLGFEDGQLNNQTMIETGHKIVELAEHIIGSTSPDTVIEFMTTDLNGMTGHIDHIVAARAACWAFYHLKATDERFGRIRLACVPYAAQPVQNTDWLYMEPGRTDQEINEVIDARSLQQDIIAIVRAHHSQRDDGERYLAGQGDNLGLNYFIVKQ